MKRPVFAANWKMNVGPQETREYFKKFLADFPSTDDRTVIFFPSAVSLAVAGVGIAQSYDFIAREQLANGRLVELLPQLRGRSRPFSVLYAPHRRQSGATRAMIALLTAA